MRFLTLALVKRVLLHPSSVGDWLVDQLRTPSKQASAVDYLEVVSHVSAASDQATGVIETISEIQNFLPLMLGLPPHLAERVAVIPIVIKIMTSKVTFSRRMLDRDYNLRGFPVSRRAARFATVRHGQAGALGASTTRRQAPS